MNRTRMMRAAEGEREGVTVGLYEDDERWRLEFQSSAFYLKDSKGLRYLRLLVERPGERLALEEVAEGATDPGRRAALEDRRRLRTRIESLRDAREVAEDWNDGARRLSARTELEELVDELGARRRGPRDEAEKTRKSVAIAIRRAITAIGRHQPLLAAHLEVSVRTGGSLAYVPDPLAGVRWSCGSTADRPLRAVA